ncbi:MAG TPA: hypothetical protein VJO32_06810 [Ktedonobacteraceae bacterium]|nr:hypothetical protein [Ktedonobacteraceae bacterium]
MEPILVALVALFVAVVLIIGGTRFSLYLFLLSVEGTRHFAQRMPTTKERMPQDTAYRVERQMYYGNVDTGSSSARFARNSLIVIALILLLGIVATVSIVAGLFH